MSSKEHTATPRRALFPTSYSKKGSKKEKYVSWSPYARCAKMECLNLTEKEKSEMWWQKSDYDDFAKVGRIISKAMLAGGSEIWLRSKSPPSSPRKSGTIDTDSDKISNVNTSPATTKGDTMIESSPSLSLSLSSSSNIVNPQQPLHHNCNTTSKSSSNSQDFYQIRDKWWCNFGHSRRGLEHVASNAEGRQRHLNARSAVRSVMEEQQRQRMFLPKGYSDVDKFRTVYLKETHWARVLARAAGGSDADAVTTNFDDSRRKPREFYLKKHLDDNSDHYVSTSNEMILPIFMNVVTASTSKNALHSSKKLNLDANTASQIRFRKSQRIPSTSSSKLQEKNEKSKGKAKTKIAKKFANRELSAVVHEEKKSEHDDVNDNDDASSSSSSTEDSSSSLAKMAAGWGIDESQEDMSSVLIGMGISTKPKITIG